MYNSNYRRKRDDQDPPAKNLNPGQTPGQTPGPSPADKSNEDKITTNTDSGQHGVGNAAGASMTKASDSTSPKKPGNEVTNPHPPPTSKPVCNPDL